MRAKLTVGNRLTLPEAAIADMEAAEYFDVTVEDGRIILTPAHVKRADAVRAKLAELGLSEADLTDAVAWARLGECRRRAVASATKAQRRRHHRHGQIEPCTLILSNRMYVRKARPWMRN